MNKFDLYIHGAPRGHQIWGCDRNHEFIELFYNGDSSITYKPVLLIDIYMGDTYYTYFRKKDVYDSGGRSGSFFAMTICFRKSYCTNVYKLYQIFDKVYTQVCIGSIIKQKDDQEQFLVSDFVDSRSGNMATVDKIRAIFIKNIENLIEPYLFPLENVADTFNKAKLCYSLKEVDSPVFFDFFEKQSLLVTPCLEPAIIANQSIRQQLKVTKAQKEKLESVNEQLQASNSQLIKENMALSDSLESNDLQLENESSATINQPRSNLSPLTRERDLNETSIRKIDELPQKTNKTFSNQMWRPGLNSLLICIVIILCFTILYFVRNTDRVDHDKSVSSNPAELTEDTVKTTSAIEANDTIPASSAPPYDDWAICKINIVGGGNNIKKGKTYSLKISNTQTNPWSDANVPQGEWSVFIIPNQPINTNNEFTLPSSVAPNMVVMIEYIVDGRVVLRRNTTVL